jgi:hypothetical protein
VGVNQYAQFSRKAAGARVHYVKSLTISNLCPLRVSPLVLPKFVIRKWRQRLFTPMRPDVTVPPSNSEQDAGLEHRLRFRKRSFLADSPIGILLLPTTAAPLLSTCPNALVRRYVFGPSAGNDKNIRKK